MTESGREVSANSTSDRPGRPHDRFTWRPTAVAAALWFLTVVPLALGDLGGPVPSLWQMFEFLVIVLTFLTYVASCLLSVLQGRWYRAITRMSAFVTLAAASFVTFHYRQDLKFHAALLSISTEIALHRATDGQPREVTRYFTDGNSSSWSLFEYDETDREAPDVGQEVKAWTSYEWNRNGCAVTVRRLDIHLFLKTVNCTETSPS